MDSELIKRARALMQKIPQAPTTTPAVVEQSAPVVSARAILAEHDEAEVIQIMEVWRRLFGFSESRKHIETSLRDISRWQARRDQDGIYRPEILPTAG